MKGVFKYFDTYPLQTKKAKSYQIWREIQQASLNGEHLSPDSRLILKANSATINKIK